MFRRRLDPALFAGCLLIALTGGGCSRARTITISTIPPDATLRIDDRDRGRGPITETFTFPGYAPVHRVLAERPGYRPHNLTITPDEERDAILIDLKPAPRRVTFSVEPMPGVVKLDGRPLADAPVAEVATDLEFRVGPGGQWNTHRVTAEREGFTPAERTLRHDDPEALYVLELGARRKDLQITTTPADAEVYVNDKLLGKSPITHAGFSFPVDVETGQHAPQRLRIRKPGYGDVQAEIGWDEGKTNYEYTLRPQEKLVRITTNPPDALVTLGGVELPRDASGAAVTRRPIAFGPRNDRGDLAAYTGTAVRKKAGDAEWEPATFTIEWDDGKVDYHVELKEILVRRVPLLRVRSTFGEGGWSVAGERSTTLATKDVGEGPGRPRPVQVTRQPKGTVIDSLSVSPDGSTICFTTLSDASGKLLSRILTQRADGPADAVQRSDGKSLEVTPSYTPDGSQLVFASDRGGRRLSIWTMSATDARPVPEQLTAGEGIDLWPSVDSNPRPRLFYESRIDTRPDPRLFSKPLDGMRKDLTPLPAGAMQPRVSPTADAVLFCAADERTGNRDVFRMSDAGREVINLTNTPDADEFDATWSSDGLRVAYASNAGRTEEAPDNYDVYVLDAAGGGTPARVTANPGWDDSPAWDAAGGAIYFRSNRGGGWNIWRVEVK